MHLFRAQKFAGQVPEVLGSIGLFRRSADEDPAVSLHGKRILCLAMSPESNLTTVSCTLLCSVTLASDLGSSRTPCDHSRDEWGCGPRVQACEERRLRRVRRRDAGRAVRGEGCGSIQDCKAPHFNRTDTRFANLSAVYSTMHQFSCTLVRYAKSSQSHYSVVVSGLRSGPQRRARGTGGM